MHTPTAQVMPDPDRMGFWTLSVGCRVGVCRELQDSFAPYSSLVQLLFSIEFITVSIIQFSTCCSHVLPR